jgi:hypothetical protein
MIRAVPVISVQDTIMPARLVALDEGADIPLDRTMVVVGRHPQCDARLDSLRVSRHHCCMTQDQGEIVVRDLGSTNGIRINGQRVEVGRLRPGDELSIAHIRFRFDGGQSHKQSPVCESRARVHLPISDEDKRSASDLMQAPSDPAPPEDVVPAAVEESPLARAVREMLPAGLADRCRIQVVVQMRDNEGGEVDAEKLDACQPNSSPSAAVLIPPFPSSDPSS